VEGNTVSQVTRCSSEMEFHEELYIRFNLLTLQKNNYMWIPLNVVDKKDMQNQCYITMIQRE